MKNPSNIAAFPVETFAYPGMTILAGDDPYALSDLASQLSAATAHKTLQFSLCANKDCNEEQAALLVSIKSLAAKHSFHALLAMTISENNVPEYAENLADTVFELEWLGGPQYGLCCTKDRSGLIGRYYQTLRYDTKSHRLSSAEYIKLPSEEDMQTYRQGNDAVAVERFYDWWDAGGWKIVGAAKAYKNGGGA